MNTETDTQSSWRSTSVSCGDGNAFIERREFIKATGLTAAMLMAGRINVMAGPFEVKDFDKINPADKKLSKEWIASLYARGEALSATGENLTVLSYAQDPKTQLNIRTEWIVECGKGNVYNSTLGHVWHDDSKPLGAHCVGFQTILVRAVEWLARGEVTSAVPSNFPDESAVSLN